MSDICGESPNPPKHARAFGDLGRLHRQLYAARVAALGAYRQAVLEGTFPTREESVFMTSEEVEKLKEALDRES